MYSSPGNHGSCSGGMVLTYGVETVAGKPTWCSRARSSSFDQQEAGPGLAVGVDDGVERVEPLRGLLRIDVGKLVREPVEDHGVHSRRMAGSVPAGALVPRPTIVYTDGACRGNPGPGGWAWAVPDGGPYAQRRPTPHTTNQRMEISAALEAVTRARPAPLEVRQRLDLRRQLLPRPLVGGLAGNGAGATRKRKPVANRDLWEPLVELVRERGDVDVPLGQGPRRRPDERPRRPAGRGRGDRRRRLPLTPRPAPGVRNRLGIRDDQCHRQVGVGGRRRTGGLSAGLPGVEDHAAVGGAP